MRDLFSQSMVTNEVALTFNWSSKRHDIHLVALTFDWSGRRREIHLANQWSPMKLPLPLISRVEGARFINQSMVTSEVALTFDWSGRRRDILLANQWSPVKLP